MRSMKPNDQDEYHACLDEDGDYNDYNDDDGNYDDSDYYDDDYDDYYDEPIFQPSIFRRVRNWFNKQYMLWKYRISYFRKELDDIPF
jgi:hypothetical protein